MQSVSHHMHAQINFFYKPINSENELIIIWARLHCKIVTKVPQYRHNIKRPPQLKLVTDRSKPIP